MAEEQKKPCYEVSYIKVTYGKDGKISSITVKVVNKAQKER